MCEQVEPKPVSEGGRHLQGPAVKQVQDRVLSWRHVERKLDSKPDVYKLGETRHFFPPTTRVYTRYARMDVSSSGAIATA